MVCILASSLLLCAQDAPKWSLVRADPGSSEDGGPILERLVTGPGGQLDAVSERLLLTSANAGANWSLQPSRDDFRIEALAFSTPDTLWGAAWDHGATFLGSSSDGGATWKQALTLRPGPAAIGDIAFFDENFGIAVGAFDLKSLILTTRDGGRSWHLQLLESESPDPVLRRVAFLSKSEIWVVGGSSIYVSRNGGSDWDGFRPENTIFLNDIAITRSGIFVVGGWGTMLRSQDDGETWSKIQLMEPLASRFLWSITFRDASRAWVAGEKGTIASTSDGGQTWQIDETGRHEFIRDIKVIGDKVFAVGDNGTILQRVENRR